MRDTKQNDLPSFAGTACIAHDLLQRVDLQPNIMWLLRLCLASVDFAADLKHFLIFQQPHPVNILLTAESMCSLPLPERDRFSEIIFRNVIRQVAQITSRHVYVFVSKTSK